MSFHHMVPPGLSGHPETFRRGFVTTNWTVVLKAGGAESPEAAAALSQLCERYWEPIHAFIQHTTRNTDSAADLTQQFFTQFLQKESYKKAQRERGRFRAFLLTAVKHFLVNERERMAAQKRGGGQAAISLEALAESRGNDAEPGDTWTAERIYEQNWALSLLSQVRLRLRAEYSKEGKDERFIQLEQLLPGQERSMTYAEAAARFGLAEGTLKSDVHRWKRRYRELLREEIAHTVEGPEEIDAEIRYLMAVLGRPAH